MTSNPLPVESLDSCDDSTDIRASDLGYGELLFTESVDHLDYRIAVAMSLLVACVCLLYSVWFALILGTICVGFSIGFEFTRGSGLKVLNIYERGITIQQRSTRHAILFRRALSLQFKTSVVNCWDPELPINVGNVCTEFTFVYRDESGKRQEVFYISEKQTDQFKLMRDRANAEIASRNHCDYST